MPDPLPGEWPPAPLIYELYPRSFQDSNGDGIGDLPGILARIDHLAALNVDAVWICPFHDSPWVDGGYDVSDYTAIHPTLGTLDDLARLTEALHDRGIRIMADLVLNHTSIDHPWFEKSARREDGYADHYVWHDAGPAGAPPTNWIGRFGNAAWTWDHRREQYYLHNYMAEQPALNLRCDVVKREIDAIFDFWRGQGIDGFRLDAVTSYLCDPDFRDNPPASPEARAKMDGEPFLPYVRQDHIHDFLPGDGAAYCDNLRAWAGKTSYLLGEIGSGNQSVEISNNFTDPGRLNAGYAVDLAQFGFTADVVADMLTRRSQPSTLAWWTGSHDRARQVTGPQDPEARLEIAFLAFMPGPALLYQGQELGLPQPDLSKAEATDPYDLAFWPDGPMREGARVPLPWDGSAGYGFTTGDPWLPMRWQSGCAAAAQTGDDALPFAKRALLLRRDLGLAALPDHHWSRNGHLIRIDYPNATVLFNLGNSPAHRPDDITGDPDLATSPITDTLPARTAAIWAQARVSVSDKPNGCDP